ncbi:MAG TPA: toll/interleukin-1 receptor domain-containing protein [Geminicoccaceae bacterium]
MDRRHGAAHLVFISHSTKDRWIARQMASIIESRGRRYGIGTFLDERDIEGGDSIPETILAKLRDCQEFVILLSPQSVTRQWVLVELGAALGLQKHIVPIIHNVAPTDIPDIIRLTKAHELNDFEHYLDELVRRVRGAGKG